MAQALPEAAVRLDDEPRGVGRHQMIDRPRTVAASPLARIVEEGPTTNDAIAQAEHLHLVAPTSVTRP